MPREKIFSSESVVSHAYKSDDQTGKELTKEILKNAVKTAKGELRHVQTHADYRRLCTCAAYNTLIAVLSNVQDKLNFYTNFLFTENPMKDEAIFESMIDQKKTFIFDIEINFKPGNQKRFVAVRRSARVSQRDLDETEIMGTVQYMQSHYLSDSSLIESFSQYDYSNSVVLAVGNSKSRFEFSLF